MTHYRALALAIVLGSCVPPAAAFQSTDDSKPAKTSGFYIRGEVGNGTLIYDGDEAQDTAMSGWLGYSFNSVIAVEAHGGTLGKDSEDGSTVKMDATGIGLRLKKDFESGWYLAGRVGQERITTSFDGLVYDEYGNLWRVDYEESENNLYYGIGAGIILGSTGKFSLTGYWDSRDVPLMDQDVRVETLTIGGEYRF